MNVILELEYYLGDTLLMGKVASYSELCSQIKYVEQSYDVNQDNFAAMLCRSYGWEIIDCNVTPDYIYDRDTKRLMKQN